ncbi:MAG: hypothetical protein M1833_003901 [Piccolia ochrophora]|nr:MAG: hypothetical protein M1833_003901 [Piccolia ochrophora]
MDHSPFKRRKLSPTAHVPGDAPTTPGEKSQKGEEERTTPGRASFASPTKASLARYNPTLLSPSKTRSTRSKKGNGESTAAQPPNTNGQRTPTDGNERARSRPGSAQPDRVDPVTSQEAPLQAAPNVSAPRTTRSTAATGLAAAPRRRSSRTPLNEDSPSKRLQSIAQDAENAAAQLKQETAAAARSMEEGPEEVGEDGRNRLPPAHDAPFEATTRQRTDQPRSDVPPTAPPRAPTPPTLQVQRTGLLSSPSKRPKRKQRLLSPFNEPPPKRKPYLPPDPIPEAQKRITRNRPEREPDVEEDSSEKIQLRDKLLAQLCALQAEVEQAERAVAKATQQSLNDETLDSSTTKDLLYTTLFYAP